MRIARADRPCKSMSGMSGLTSTAAGGTVAGMRVLSSVVLAAWLLGGVAAPCFARVPCAGTARHACCCDNPSRCCCHLTAGGSPAAPTTIATFATTSALQGFAGAHAASHAAPMIAPSYDDAASSDPGPVYPAPSYLSSCVFRC